MQLFKKIEDYFLDNDYVKDLSSLVSGTMIANLIPILISPVLARMYTPEAFGTFGLYIGIVNIATIIFTGRYELAIILSKSKEEARDLFYLALLIGLFCLVLGYVIIGMLFALAPGFSSTSHFWVFAIPVSAYLVAMNRSFIYFSSNIQDYKSIAINKITRATSVASLKVLFFPVFKSFGLILGNLTGFLITVLSYLIVVIKKKQFDFQRIDFRSLFSTAKLHKKFFQFDLFSGLLNAISLNIPIIIISIYYADDIVGQYSMAFTIINIPMMLIGSSIGQIYYERISKIDSQKEIAHSTSKVINQLILMGSIMMVILIFGDKLFAFILGKRWVQAGEFAQYMSPWVYLVFIAAPVSNIYLRKSQQNKLMNFNVILLISRTLVLMGSIYLIEDVNLIILLFSITGFVVWFVLYLRILKICNLPVKRFSFRLLLPVFAGLLLLFIRTVVTSSLNG